MVNRVLALGGAVISHDHYAHGRSGPHQADSVHRCQIYRYTLLYNFYFDVRITSVGGVMVSIDAFQALDPGSIPGHRNFFTTFTQLTHFSFHNAARDINLRLKSTKERFPGVDIFLHGHRHSV